MPHTNIYVPEAGAELGIVVLVVLVSVLLHAFLQRQFRSEALRRNNEVAGYLFSAVGVIYAVVLGFVVVVVWQKYDTTVSNVEAEVSAAADLYRDTAGFPPGLESSLRAQLRAYIGEVIDVEWPAMDRGTGVAPHLALLERLAYDINTYVPRNAGESNAQQAAMEQERRLFDARRQRLIQSAPSVPSALWFALVAGGLSMLVFAFLFGVENRPTQLVMTAILAGLIATLFVVILEFDGPFSGSVSISDDGWTALQQNLTTVP